jgi:hypothetical protein
VEYYANGECYGIFLGIFEKYPTPKTLMRYAMTQGYYAKRVLYFNCGEKHKKGATLKTV